MITWTEQQTMCKNISNLSDATSILNFKRDLNAGTARFLTALGRPVDRQSRFTSLTATQQYYQLPEDAIRVSKVKALNGTNIWFDLEEIGDEDAWILLNQTVQSGAIPRYYFVRGFDEVGLFPIPSQTLTNGIEIVYEPKHVLLTAEDYTTGTLTLANGSAAVVGASTVFTAQMANGMYVLQTTDGSDGNYYKVTAFTDATHITLENFYQGLSGSSVAYRIGQVSKIPEEYQEAPVDYAMYRHFLEKNEMAQANLFKQLWEGTLATAKDIYGMATANQIIKASASAKRYNPLTDISSNMINT